LLNTLKITFSLGACFGRAPQFCFQPILSIVQVKPAVTRQTCRQHGHHQTLLRPRRLGDLGPYPASSQRGAQTRSPCHPYDQLYL
jgi:hypothetical protein